MKWSISVFALTGIPLVVHARVESLHVDLFNFFVILEFIFGEVDSGVNRVVFGIGPAFFGVAFVGAALFSGGSVVVLV